MVFDYHLFLASIIFHPTSLPLPLSYLCISSLPMLNPSILDCSGSSPTFFHFLWGIHLHTFSYWVVMFIWLSILYIFCFFLSSRLQIIISGPSRSLHLSINKHLKFIVSQSIFTGSIGGSVVEFSPAKVYLQSFLIKPLLLRAVTWWEILSFT
jgi:hypothetical protein